MPSRRTFLAGAGALGVASLGGAPFARAQNSFPSRLIKIVIANPPGGDDDTLSRYIADKIVPDLGQTVIVENRGGAATTIGSMAVAHAVPDGYTILCLHSAALVQTVLRDSLKYSMKSFAPIIKVGGYPMALVVSATSNIKTIDDIKAIAKTPDGISFATAGAGTMAHLATVRFLRAIGGHGLHVPYKNNPEGMQSIIGGYTQMMFVSAREGSNLRGDKLLRVIAVTAPERTANLPDVPTMREVGLPEIDSQLWYSYAAPAGTPPAVLARLADAIRKVTLSDAFKERFIPLSLEIDILTGAELTQFWAKEAERWRAVIVENNIKFTD